MYRSSTSAIKEFPEVRCKSCYSRIPRNNAPQVLQLLFADPPQHDAAMPPTPHLSSRSSGTTTSSGTAHGDHLQTPMGMLPMGGANNGAVSVPSTDPVLYSASAASPTECGNVYAVSEYFSRGMAQGKLVHKVFSSEPLSEKEVKGL